MALAVRAGWGVGAVEDGVGGLVAPAAREVRLQQRPYAGVADDGVRVVVTSAIRC